MSFKVQTQLVTIHRPQIATERELGLPKARLPKRIGSKKTRWRTWNRRKHFSENIRDAINYVTNQMISRHIGGIVIIRQTVDGYSLPNYVKIFQAKWGTDDKPFTRFEGIAGDYWRRKLRVG